MEAGSPRPPRNSTGRMVPELIRTTSLELGVVGLGGRPGSGEDGGGGGGGAVPGGRSMVSPGGSGRMTSPTRLGGMGTGAPTARSGLGSPGRTRTASTPTAAAAAAVERPSNAPDLPPAAKRRPNLYEHGRPATSGVGPWLFASRHHMRATSTLAHHAIHQMPVTSQTARHVTHRMRVTPSTHATSFTTRTPRRPTHHMAFF
jgi:hypothetical protein